MSTHAGALLLPALAYTYSRRYAEDPPFSFGTGKLGDLAGFTSAIVLAMIALLIGYEAVVRFLHPVGIHLGEAIPIAVLGLGGECRQRLAAQQSGGHHHVHSHGCGHDHSACDHEDQAHRLHTAFGPVELSVFEDRFPPRFRLVWNGGDRLEAATVVVQTQRPDGSIRDFSFADRGAYLKSVDEIPEPHAFSARFAVAGEEGQTVVFEEHEHGRCCGLATGAATMFGGAPALRFQSALGVFPWLQQRPSSASRSSTSCPRPSNLAARILHR